MSFQLPLELSSRPLKRFDNFISGDNEWLISSLKSSQLQDGERLHYVWADTGHGKSHLLQACINQAIDQGIVAAYLPLSDSQVTPDVLIGLEQCDLIAVDDIDAVTGNSLWEEALFHFFNRCKDAACIVLFSAKVAPIDLKCNLADLQSRFSWCQVSKIASLSDKGLIEVMKQTALQLALPIEEEHCQYILLRYPRRIDKLIEAIELLNRLSLSEQRRITIPFIKKSLYI
jgi:DnaA-homolog protein